MIQLQAHKGVSTENPENTMPAFLSAAEQGYDTIELDVGVTKVLQFVLLHDDTINRTARNADGSELTETIYLKDLTYEEALTYDFGCWFSKKFTGTKIPLLSDVLLVAKEQGILLKIDNKYLRYSESEKKAFFTFLKPYEKIACLTCNTLAAVKEAVEYFPDMHIHYDGIVDPEHLEALAEFVKKGQLTVWLPFRNKHTSWVKVPFAEQELCALVKEYAKLGIWLLSEYDELEKVEQLRADIVETNGQLKPVRRVGWLADMHTHSENSHDSTCRMEDMCLAQMEQGIHFMANTDHCDISGYASRDIGAPIKASFETATGLKEKYGDKCLVLTGVEISGGTWYPMECHELQTMVPYDVLIGSVHAVRPGIGKPLSEFDKEDAALYVETYLNNALQMLDNTEMDILAHLTYPIRYVNGHYGHGIDIRNYWDIVQKILEKVIAKGIALEINTSSYNLLDDFMPGRDIIREYRKMGGYLITLASDAHKAENAAIQFDKAVAFLKETGFRNIFYFEARKCCQCTIGDCQ